MVSIPLIQNKSTFPVLEKLCTSNYGTPQYIVDPSNVACDKPQLVINRSVLLLAITYGYYMVGNRIFHVLSDEMDLNPSHWKRLNSLLHECYDRDTGRFNYSLANSVCVRTAKSRLLPLFMFVPCCHCLQCQSKRCRFYSYRFQNESYFHKRPPLFVTLTQRENNLPSKDLCQKFIKRLRVNSGVKGLKYFLVSEKGTTSTHRVHYHLLLFGLDYDMFIPKQVQECVDLILRSWSLDLRKKDVTFRSSQVGKRIYRRQSPTSIGLVDVCPTDGRKSLYSYISKYLFKQSCNFYLCSKGLGLSLPSGLYDSFLKQDYRFDYLTPYGQKFKYTIDKGHLRKYFPGLGSFFSRAQRNSYYNLWHDIKRLRQSGVVLPTLDDFARSMERLLDYHHLDCPLYIDYGVFGTSDAARFMCRYVETAPSDVDYIEIPESTLLDVATHAFECVNDLKPTHERLMSLFQQGIRYDKIVDARIAYFKSFPASVPDRRKAEKYFKNSSADRQGQQFVEQ